MSESVSPRPDSVRFEIACDCDETWYPHKGGNYHSRYSEWPWCPHCGTDWRELKGASKYVDDSGNPKWTRDEWKQNALPNGVAQGKPDDFAYPEDY